MVEIDTVLAFIQATGIIVGVAYYILNIQDNQRNQQLQLETRQAQLFMQLYNRWSDPDFGKYYGTARYKYTEHIFEILKKSVEPYDPEVHTPFHSLGQFFEGMGMLVKKGLINIEYVDELLSYRIVWWWEKMKPMYERERKLMGDPDLYGNTEYLYDEIIKRGYKAPPLIEVLDTEP